MADVTKSPYDAVAKEAYDYVKGKNIAIANIVFGQSGVSDPGWLSEVYSMATMPVRYECKSALRERTDFANIEIIYQMTLDRQKVLFKKYGKQVNGTLNASEEVRQEELNLLEMDTYGPAIDVYATATVAFGCGNCMELSALTFQYLRDKKVRPLDWIGQDGIFSKNGLGDHAFVIIGRDGKTKVNELSTWNPEVVWCDPYESEMGGLDKIKERFKGKTLRLFFRLD